MLHCLLNQTGASVGWAERTTWHRYLLDARVRALQLQQVLQHSIVPAERCEVAGLGLVEPERPPVTGHSTRMAFAAPDDVQLLVALCACS